MSCPSSQTGTLAPDSLVPLALECMCLAFATAVGNGTGLRRSPRWIIFEVVSGQPRVFSKHLVDVVATGMAARRSRGLRLRNG